MKRLRFALTLLLGIVWVQLFGQSTFSGTGNWSDPARWSAGVPSGTTAAIIENGANCTVDMAGAICASLSFNANNSNSLITISGANDLTVSGAITFIDPLADNFSQTINVGGGALTAGSIAFANTFNSTRTNNINISTGTFTVNGNIVLNGANNENFIVYSDTGSGSITGNITGTGRLDLNGATITITGSCTMNGIINLTTGTLNVTGDFTGAGTFSSGTSTINYNGAGAQNMGAYTYYNLQTNNGGTKTLVGTTTINNILTLNQPLSVNTRTLNLNTALAQDIQGIPTNLITAAGSSLNYNGNGGTITIPSSVTALTGLTINNTSGITLGANLTTLTNLTLQAGVLNNSVNNISLAATNTITVTSGSLLSQLTGYGTTRNLIYNTGGAITMGGSNEIEQAQLTAGTVSINALTISVNSTNLSLNSSISTLNVASNFTMNNASTLTFDATNPQTANVTGTFAGQTLNMSGGNLAHNLNLSNTFTLVSLSSGTSSTITLQGSAGQVLPALTSYNNVTLSNTGAKSIAGNVTIGGVLTLNQNLSLGNYNLTISPNGLFAGTFGSSAMIITSGSGNLIKQGNNAAAFVTTYPVGNGVNYSPLVISSLGTTTVTPTASLTIRSIQSVHPITTVVANMMNKYWIVSTSNLSGLDITGYFQYNDPDEITGTDASFVAERFTSVWNADAALSVNPTTDRIHLTNASNLSGDFTANDAAAFLSDPNLIVSVSAGAWDNAANWSPATVPSLATQNVYIKHAITASTSPRAVNDLKISPTGTFAPGAQSFTVGGNLLIQSGGSLTLGSNNFTVTGTSTVDGTITDITGTGTNTFTGTVTINGVWNFNQAVFFSSSLYFNGTAFTSSGANTFSNTANIGGNNAYTIGTITVNGGANITNTNTNTATGLTINTALNGLGTFTQGSNTMLTYVPNSIAITGFDATAAGNTVHYNVNALQTVKATTYHHLRTSQNIKTFEDGAIIVNGNLIVSSGTLQTAATNTGTLTLQGGLSNSGTLNLWLTTAQFCNATINGTSVSGNGVYAFSDITFGGSTMSWSATTNINVYGSFFDNTTTSFSAVAGNFVFRAPISQVIDGTSPGTTTFSTLQVGSAVTDNTILTLNRNITTTNIVFNLSLTGSLSLNGRTLIVNGNHTRTNNGRFTGGANSILTINGSGTLTNSLLFDLTTPGTTNFIETLTVNRASSGTVTLGSDVAVNNINILQGILATAQSVSIYGDFTNNATYNQTANTTLFDKNGTQSITTTGTPTTTTFYNLSIGAANNPTLSANISFNVGGNFTQNSANPFTATSGTATFTPNAAQAIQGAGLGAVTFYNMTAAGGNTKSISRNFSVSNSLTINTGVTLQFDGTTRSVTTKDLTTVGSGTVNVASAGATTHSLGISGTLTNAGTLNMRASGTQLCNVTLTGSSVSGNGTYIFNNLTIGGNALSWSSASNINIYNTFTNNTAISFVASAGTFVFNQAVAQAINGTSGTTTFNGLSIGNINDCQVSLGTNIQTNGTLTINTTTSGYLDLNGKTLTINGPYTRSNNGQFRSNGATAATASLILSGSGAVGGSIFFLATDNAISNLTHNRTANNFTLGNAITVTGTLNLNQGTLTNGANLTMANGSTITRSNSTALLTATPTAAGLYNVNYTGAVTTSFECPSLTNVLNNLIINPGAGSEVILNAAKTINGTITFTSGYLNISNYDLTLAPTASTSGATTSRFIRCGGSGSLIKQGTISDHFQILYPIGTTTNYSPFTITSLAGVPAGTATLTIRSIEAYHPLTSGTNLSLIRYWTIAPANLSITSVDGSFVYADADIGSGTEVNFTNVGRNYASVWNNNEAGTSIDHGTNTIGLAGVSTLAGEWTAGDPSAFGIPNYTTSQNGNWSTAATWVGGVVPPTGANVIINHIVTHDANITVTDLTINSAGQLTLGNFPFTVLGSSIIDGTIIKTANTNATVFNDDVTIGGTWNFSRDVSFGGGLFFNGVSFTSTATNTFLNTANIGGGNPFSIGTLTVNGGVVLTNTHTDATSGLTISTALNGAGTFQQGGNAVLTIIPASIAVTGFSATAAGNTVYFNTNAAQTIKATTYHHLKTNQNTKTLENGDIIVNGDLTIVGGILQSAATNTGTLLVYGNISNTGTMNMWRAAGQYCDVTLDANTTAVSGTGAFSFNNLTIQNTNLTWSGSGLVSIYGAFNDNSTVQFNAIAGTFQFLSGLAQAINGTGTLTSFNNLTIGNNNTTLVTLNKNIVANTNLTLNISGVSPDNGILLNGHTITINGTTTNTRGTFDARTSGGYIIVNGNNTAAMTLAQINGTLNGLTVNKSGTNSTVALTNALDVTDVLIANGTLSTTANLNVYGDFTNNATFSQTTPGTTTFDKNGAQNITTSGTPVATTFFNLTFGSANNPTVNTNISFNVAGNITQSSSNPFTASAGTITLTNTLSIQGAGVGLVTFNNLSTSGATVKTIARSFNVAGDLSVTAGTLLFNTATSTTMNVTGNVNVSAGATFQVNNSAQTHNLNITGNLTNNGTFTMWRATDQYVDVALQGTSVTGNGTYNFNNLTMGGVATTWTPTSTINLYGGFTDNTTTSFTSTAGTFLYRSGAAQSIDGTSPGTTTFNAIQIGQAVGDNTVLTLNRDVVTTNITFNVSTTGALSLNDRIFVINGNHIRTNNGKFTGSSNAVLIINGSGNPSNSFNFDVTTPPTTNNLHTLTINRSGGGVVTLNTALVVSNTLNLTEGTFTNGANLTMGAGATIVRSSSTALLSATPTAAGVYNVTYNAPVTSSFELPAGVTVLNDLTINPGAGNEVALAASRTVNGALTLSSGYFNISNFNLTMNSTASISGAGASSFIRSSGTGSLIRQSTNAADFVMTYPVGTLTEYTPFTISALTATPAGTATLAVRSTNSQHPLTTGTSLSLIRYWTITPTNLTVTSVDGSFSYADIDVGSGTETNFTTVGRNQSSVWYTNEAGTSIDHGTNSITLAAAAQLAGEWTAGDPAGIVTDPNLIVSISAGAWDNAANWSPAVVPNLATHNVYIKHAITASLSARAINNLQISPTGSFNPGGQNFTVGGDLIIENGGSLTLANANFTVTGNSTINGTFTENTGTGTNTFTGAVTINGTWASNQSFTLGNSFTYNGTSFTGTGTYTFDPASGSTNIGGGRAFTMGTISVANARTLINTHTETTTGLTISTALSGTGTFRQGTSTILTYTPAAVIAISNFDAATNVNTVYYNGGAQTIKATTYHHLKTNSGVKTLESGAITVNGDMTIVANTVQTAATNTGTLQLKGNLSNAGVLNMRLAAAQYCDVTIDANASTISGAGTFAFNNLTVQNNGLTWSASGAVSMYGNFTDNCSSFNATAGRFTFLSGGAQSIGGTGASTTFFNLTTQTNSTIVNLNKNITIAGTANSTTTGDGAAFGVEAGTPAFNADSYSITMTGAGGTFVNEAATTSSFNCGTGSLIANSGGTNSLNGTTTFYNLTVSSGTLTTASNITLLNNFTNDATFNQTANTTTFDSNGAQSITTTGAPTATTFNNLTFGSSNNPTVNTNINVNVSGNITQNSSNPFTATTGTTTLPGTMAIQGAGAGIITFYNLSTTTGGTKTIARSFDVANDINVVAGTLLFNTATSTVVNVTGNVNVSSTGTFQVNSTPQTHTLNITGNLVNDNSFNMYRAAGQYVDVTIGGSSISGNGATYVFNNLALAGGATTWSSTSNVSIYGNFADNTATSFNASAGAFIFRAPVNQSIEGTSPGTTTFNTIQVGTGTENTILTLNRDITTTNVVFNVTATGAISLNDRLMIINGNHTRTNNGKFTGSVNAAITINGSGNPTSTVLFDATTLGTTNYIKSITINRAGSGVVTFGNVLAVENLTITQGTLTTGSNLNIYGDLTNNATFSQIANTTYFDKNGTQNITTTGTPAATTFNNIQIGNANNPQVNCNISYNINGNFTSNSSGVDGGATIAYDASAGTTTFLPNAAQAIGGAGSGTVNFYNVITAGGNTKTANIGFNILGNLTINNGVTLNLGTTSKTVAVTGSATIDGTLNFGATAATTFSVGGDLVDITGTITMQTAGLAHTLNLGGAHNAITTFSTTAGAPSVVNYNRAGDQQVFGGTYQNLTISNGSTKTLAGNITLGTATSGILTLNLGVLQLSNYNLTVANNDAAAIQGTFDASSMIATDGPLSGTGYLQKNGTSAAHYILKYPVGSGGYYTPMEITNMTIFPANLKVKAVPTAVNPSYINKYWDIQSNIALSNVTAIFTYNPAELNGATFSISYSPNAGSTWQNPPSSGTSSFVGNTFTITGNTPFTGSSSPFNGWWTMGLRTYYSYQTGDWNTPTTWTSDPSGTLQIGSTIPGTNDNVVILSGRTVSLSGNVSTSNLNISINDGGFLDQTTYRFTQPLQSLSGQGTLRLATTNFPTGTTSSFTNAGGGTTEYSNTSSFTLPITQTAYNNLTINTNGQIATQLSNLTLNGNLYVKQGAFRINDDASSTKLTLTINGGVTVDNAAAIAVGKGATNTTTNPILIIGGTTAPFLDYYTQFHTVIVKGDFTNYGTVKFTNLDYPVYDAFPPTVSGTNTGAASVYFQGNADNTLTCEGITDFYNLILDKGTDQTYKLTINSSDYGYFRLFGANISGGDITNPATTTANPNLKKALWIRTGTLILQGLVVIPSLTEGNCNGAPTSDYIIPSNGALVLDGSNVIVLTTADSYDEVNLAYTVAGGSGLVNGVSIGSCSAMSILGKLQVNDGYLSTRESGGIITWDYSAGRLEMAGGVVDAKQFHGAGGASDIGSFIQTDGTLQLRGRMQRTTTSFTAVTDLANAPINTIRANDALIDGTVGTFGLNSTSNVFSVSGGTIQLYDATDVTGRVFDVLSSSGNINVSGGWVEFIPTAGTGGSADAANHMVRTTASLGNMTVNLASGTSVVKLENSYPLTIQKDLSLQAGSLSANNLDITIGGNFTIAAGTTYTTGTNTTVFNGTGSQTFTVDLAAALSLNKLRIDKPAGKTLTFAGSQTTIDVLDNFYLVAGTMADNGNTINIAKNVYNSGVHSGAGKIVLNGAAQTQTIDGNGIFQNLELNNTNAAYAPISLVANTTVNGALTLSQDKLFDIATFNLKLNSAATIVNADANRYIKTAGNLGDGGLTRVYPNSSAFTFPVGAASTNHATPSYTPATIGFTGTPTVYGSITVNPVGYEHPTTTTNGRSLTYFWRVKSSGFILGAATVTHGYNYDQSDVVTGSGITEDGYVAARYNSSSLLWTLGAAADVDEAANIIGEPGTGSFLENATFIDGDYTAGDNSPVNPFGAPTIYYSRINGASAGNGLWSDVNTWSTDSHTGAVAGTVPGANDVVIIGGLDSVYLATNLTVRDFDPRSCASLQIEVGSALDIGNNPASNFSMVLSHPNGNGNFRFTCNRGALGPITESFVFPLGDYSDFNANQGTTEIYTTNPSAGSIFFLPNGVYSYGNLILSPLGGSNIIFPNNDLLIYGDLVTRGENADSWFCPTWNVDYPTAPSLVVAKTITVNGDLDIQGGGFIWYGNGAIAQNLVVKGDVKVATLGAIDVRWPATATNQRMTIGGNLINNTNGLLNPGVTQTTAKCDFTYIPLTFDGSNSASITNTGTTAATTFSQVTVNKGTSQATTLTINIGGTLATLTDNWLTLQNGTLKYMRTDPDRDFTISTVTPFSIPSTAGLYIDYTSAVTRNILIANSAATSANDLNLDGKLTLVKGNVYVGPTTAPNVNNDIEYGATGNSTLDIQGGQLVVNGQIRRSAAATSGVLKYYQSAGTVTINGNATLATRGKLEVVNAGSVFNMSGSSALTIVRGGGTSFGDLYLRPGSASVTGGSITFTQTPAVGPVVDLAQSYLLEANVPINDLVITGKTAATARNATVGLMVSPLTINGGLTLSNANSILSSNNNNITIKGGFSNDGTYNYGTNNTTFSGGTQTISGTTVTNFYDLTVSPVTSLTPNNSFTVNRNLNIGNGIFVLSDKKVTLMGNLTNNGTYTDDNITGGISLSGAAQQQIYGIGSFGRLELNNSFGAKINNDVTLQNNFVMTQGVLDINQHQFTLGQNSIISAASFGLTKMIIADGVATSKGLRKFFNTGATNFTFPVGVLGKYTPAVYSLSANSTVGSITVNPVNDNHPTTDPAADVLQYYWEIESSGVSDLAGTLLLQYLPGDVRGTESDYVASQLLSPGTYWSKATPGPLTDNVDESNHQITFTISAGTNNLSGDYTAGVETALPDEVPTYQTNADGNWTDETIWTPVGSSPPCPVGGPNGFNVIIDNVISANSNYCFAYNTTINGRLEIPPSTFGHNLGAINGSGTLYLESPNLPAGNYESFFDCSGSGVLNYGGSTSYTLIATLYSSLPNITFSGSGTRTLPNKDLTVCNKLEINGPTLDNSVYNRKLTILGTMERISGSFTAGSGSSATVSFAGTSLQTVGGTTLGNFSGSNRFYNLEVNNNAGLDIGTNGAVEVGGTLMLSGGVINTSATNQLTIYNSSSSAVTPSGGSSSSYVNGPLIKRIPAGGNFIFPLGKGTEKGHAFTVTSTSGSQLYWTSEFFSPNTTANSLTVPLQATNTDESWSLKTTTSTTAKVKVAWDLSSALNPTMTQNGISDMRIAEYNSGTSKWVALTSTTSGTTSAGDVATTNNVSISTTAKYYTSGSVTTTTPRASFNPTGPVCGAAGIPYRITSFITISPTYTLYYTIDGNPQTLVVNTLTGTVPTGTSGTYQLTGFKYDNSTTDGIVDATPVVAYPLPLTANAGLDQSSCGLSGTTLTGNDPTPFTGLWTIITGSGGTILTPSAYNSVFNGVLGNAYTLRWTISSGGCKSTDDVIIAFNVSPQRPSAFTSAPTPVCQGTTRTYTVPTILGATFNWSYSGTGASIGGTPLTLVPITGLTNSVNISFDATATGGTLSVTATNACGTSAARTVAISVVAPPTITLGANPEVCRGSLNASLPYSATSGSANQYSITFDTDAINEGFVNVINNALPASPISIAIPVGAASGVYNATLTVRNSTAGCLSPSYPITVTILPLPTITLGANPAVCLGTLTAPLIYTGTSNSPDQYWIDFDATAEGEDFVDEGSELTPISPIPASPISFTVPTTAAPGVYNATIYVQNSGTGCISAGTGFTITIHPRPTSTITGLVTGDPMCEGDPVQFSIVLTGQPNFDFTVVNDHGGNWNVTDLNVASGSTYTYTVPTNPIWLGLPGVSTTYNYTITGLVDDNGCTEATPTGTATVVVYKRPETGPQYHIPNNYGL